MRRDDAYLLDMLLAGRDALEFAAGLTFREFQRSRLHQTAVLKAIETVGEAASNVSQETRQAHPEIPWKEIVGMRNRLVHVYFDVSLHRVWETVRQDVPRLVALLEPLVPPESDPSSESEP